MNNYAGDLNYTLGGALFDLLCLGVIGLLQGTGSPKAMARGVSTLMYSTFSAYKPIVPKTFPGPYYNV